MTHHDEAGRTIVLALLALFVLTGASWAIAQVHLGAANAVIALGIAAVKGSIVAWVFMELSHAPIAFRLIAFVTLLFIALLALGMLGDTLMR